MTDIQKGLSQSVADEKIRRGDSYITALINLDTLKLHDFSRSEEHTSELQSH